MFKNIIGRKGTLTDISVWLVDWIYLIYINTCRLTKTIFCAEENVGLAIEKKNSEKFRNAAKLLLFTVLKELKNWVSNQFFVYKVKLKNEIQVFKFLFSFFTEIKLETLISTYFSHLMIAGNFTALVCLLFLTIAKPWSPRKSLLPNPSNKGTQNNAP